MADLLIKPEAGSGNKLILQDQAGNAILTTADSGAALNNVTGAGPPEGTAVKSTGEAGGTKFLREDGDGTSSWQTIDAEPEGTVVKSTGEAGGTKFLREDGDGTSSWQTLPAGGTSPNYADDGFKYITSNWKDYSASSGQYAFNWANVADFDMQIHKGANVSESGGYYTLATAGVYAFSLLLLDSGYSNGTSCWIFHNDVSAGTNIAHEPLIPASTKGDSSSWIPGYAAAGSYTWFLDIEANDIVHIRCRGYMDGNWCGQGSPSCCFHGIRLG